MGCGMWDVGCGGEGNRRATRTHVLEVYDQLMTHEREAKRGGCGMWDVGCGMWDVGVKEGTVAPHVLEAYDDDESYGVEREECS